VAVRLATSALGCEVAAAGPARGVAAGAEAGHIAVRAGRDGDVEVWTDGTAFLPCFWGCVDERLLVSTHLATLVSLGLPAAVDAGGVLQYLVMLHPLGRRTLLRDAQLLPPGGRLRWSPERGARCSSRPVFTPDPSALTDDEAVAEYRAVWHEVVRDLYDRNGGSRTVLGLSGGLDSRAIAAAGASAGIRPLSYTYGERRQREVVTAQRVAAALQLPHLLVPVTDDRLLRDAAQVAARLDGAHGPAEMYESWFDDRLRSFADVIVNGLAGGPLWGDDKAVGLRDPAAVLNRTAQRYAGEAAIVAPFVGADAGDVAAAIRADLADSLFEWDLAARADAVIFWKLQNRQLRWGTMLVNALRRGGLRIEAPFLDSRFLAFAARLTADQRRNGRLYLRVHREVFPAVAGIGRSDDGNSPQGLDHVYWSGDASYLRQLRSLARRHPVSAARRAARRAGQVGAGTVAARGGPTAPADLLAHRASVFPADLWLRTRPVYAAGLADLLETAADTTPILSEHHVREAASAVRSGAPTAPALTLAKVATAGLWLRDYADRAQAVGRLGREGAASATG
jgi:asparagine synthase (glutamine-hydrolysing)